MAYYLTNNWTSPLLSFPAWLLDPPKLSKTAFPAPGAPGLTSSFSGSETSLPITPRTPTMPIAPVPSWLEPKSDSLPEHFDDKFVEINHHFNMSKQNYIRRQSPTTSTDTGTGSAQPWHQISVRKAFMIKKCENHFNAPGFKLPAKEGSKLKAPLSERELMWLSQEAFLRFLEVANGDVQQAIRKMEKGIVWRRTLNLDEMEVPRQFEKDMRTGKTIVHGFTKENWPIVYSLPNANTLTWAEDNAYSHMWFVDRAVDLCDGAEGVEKMAVIFAFFGKKHRGGPPTTVPTFLEIIVPFAEYYPGQLGVCCVQDLPWYCRLFVTIIWPFVPQRIRRIVRFLSFEEMQRQPEFVPDQTLDDCGGNLDLPWDYDSYWPTFLATCVARREEHLRRWREIGPPRAGYSERVWKVALPSAVKVKAELGLL